MLERKMSKVYSYVKLMPVYAWRAGGGEARSGTRDYRAMEAYS
jgi:hypothetical protein